MVSLLLCPPVSSKYSGTNARQVKGDNKCAWPCLTWCPIPTFPPWRRWSWASSRMKDWTRHWSTCSRFPGTMAALRDGELDFVAGPAHAVLTAFPNWEGAKLVVALARHTYWLLILRSDLGVQQGDVQAVKGLRIGAAPGPDLALKRLLQEEGIDPESDVEVGPVAATDPGVSFGVHAAQALEDGTIDGFWANAMGSEVAVHSGVGDGGAGRKAGRRPRGRATLHLSSAGYDGRQNPSRLGRSRRGGAGDSQDPTGHCGAIRRWQPSWESACSPPRKRP